jgi:photosystem II stability/assembly factor-like uncharacterized protein
MLDSHATAISPAASETVFLGLRMGLFRSDDRGATWRDTEIDRFSPLTYCHDVIVSAHDPRVLYTCLSPAAFSTDGSLYRSADPGATWRRMDHGIKAESTLMAVAEHPADPRRLACITRGGQVFGTVDSAPRGANIGCPKGWRTTTRWPARKASAYAQSDTAGPAAFDAGVGFPLEAP